MLPHVRLVLSPHVPRHKLRHDTVGRDHPQLQFTGMRVGVGVIIAGAEHSVDNLFLACMANKRNPIVGTSAGVSYRVG